MNRVVSKKKEKEFMLSVIHFVRLNGCSLEESKYPLWSYFWWKLQNGHKFFAIPQMLSSDPVRDKKG